MDQRRFRTSSGRSERTRTRKSFVRLSLILKKLLNIPFVNQTRALTQSSSLDIEPRRLTLSIPSRRTLDIDLAPSDAEIVSRISAINTASQTLSDSQETRKDQETSRTLQLKRQRDFDVDDAEAEWKVGSEVVIIYL